MPSTIYAKTIKKGKKRHHIRNIPILTIHETIISYQDLLQYLLTAAKTIYYDYDQQLTTEITIEKHLKGKYLKKTKQYRTSKLHYKRRVDLTGRLTFNPQQNTIKFDRVTFPTPEFLHFKVAYDEMRKKKWKLPTVNPKGFYATLLNPNMVCFDNLTIKTPNYETPPSTDPYATREERSHETGTYPSRNRGIYASPDRSEIISEENEKENQF